MRPCLCNFPNSYPLEDPEASLQTCNLKTTAVEKTKQQKGQSGVPGAEEVGSGIRMWGRNCNFKYDAQGKPHWESDTWAMIENKQGSDPCGCLADKHSWQWKEPLETPEYF